MENNSNFSHVTSRFASQSRTAEDLLKSQTVGLVHLSDFRKRRVEALEQKEKEAQDAMRSRHVTHLSPGNVTPQDGASTLQPLKKQKVVATAKLSFGLDVDDGTSSYSTGPHTLRLNTLDDRVEDKSDTTNTTQNGYATRRFGPNASVACAPKVMTKLALVREAQTREQLRREFLVLQELVKETEILIPFTFYDGGSLPGGVCRVKKGDHIWLFLDKARKVGAVLGVGGVDKSRREWARISVEDLMLVKGEIIIPHHYDFYHFIMNKVKGIAGPLFAYSAQPIASTPTAASNRSPYLKNSVSLFNPGRTTENIAFAQDCPSEGADHDPNLTRVVDRRWYERNKHIFPASVWEEYDPTKDYSQGIRKDSEGNTFFFA